MPFEIILSPDAGAQLAALPAHTRSEVRDRIELHLRDEPEKVSKSHHPEFLRRIQKARRDIAAGRGTRLEDIPR